RYAPRRHSAQAHAIRNDVMNFAVGKFLCLRAGQIGRLGVESACFRRLSFSVESVAVRAARAKIFASRFQIFRSLFEWTCFALFARRNGKITNAPRQNLLQPRRLIGRTKSTMNRPAA